MYYEYDDIKIYYEKYGNKKNTILILPGWGNTRQTFYSIINYFKEDYTIYIVDYPSFGNSPIPTKELDMFDYALLIKNFMHDLNIKRPIIIAHSFGGRITALLQGYYKLSIKKIILIDVAGIKRKKKFKIYIKEKIYKLLKYLIKFTPKLKQEFYKQKLLLLFSSIDYQNIPNTMRKTFQNIINKDLKYYYKNISTETLIIWGENDQDTPLKDGLLIKKLIQNSEIIVYKYSNHFSYLDYPCKTNQIIECFIK